MKRTHIARIATFLFLCVLTAEFSFAQDSLFDEITLGLAIKGQILSKYASIDGTPESVRAQAVFNSLLKTSIVTSGPLLPYELTLVDANSVNAFSTAAGKVYVTRGILPVLGDDLGVWAAVLSHEVGHAVLRHHYQAYLRALTKKQQIAYYRARAARGDTSANWALLAYGITGTLVDLKLSRDDEHAADAFGLMAMAEAGFHPDWAITMQRRMRWKVGDQSKLGAFFSDHPRWATREEHTIKAYDAALARFNYQWPDEAASPGRRPPAVAAIGHVVAQEDKTNDSLSLQIPLTIRNAQAATVMIGAFFQKDNKPVPAAMQEFKVENGSLAAATLVNPNNDRFSQNITLSIPSAAVGTKDRKLEATIAVLVGDELVEYTAPVKVSFPKLRK